nr:hypothetical protein [Ktedonobacterales bacterium]
MPAVPFTKTLSADKSAAWAWDSKTQNAILGPSDNQDWSKYQQAHAWYDGATGAEAEKKTAYKLPHHQVNASGDLECVWRGVTAAMARLKQADIPDADLKACFDHLASHYQQFDETPPDWERFITAVQQRRTLAKVRTSYPLVATRAQIAVSAARPNGVPNDADMALLSNMARAPLDPAQVYVFPTQISSQEMDAYFTRMSLWTLGQFAKNASAGVAVCDSHQHSQLNIGRSYYGEDVDTTIGGLPMAACLSLAYMLRGMRIPNGMNTLDVIQGIEGGIYQDISVGFIPLHFWCNVCGMDMLDWGSCNHWPGQTYEVKKEGSNAMTQVLCSPEVDATLAEYSIVYDGATPNAMILKGERALASSNQLTDEAMRNIRLIEDRCRVTLINRYPGATFPPSAPHARRVTIETEPQEEPEMKGSEFLARVIAEVESRSGKEISDGNLKMLRAMSESMRAGHDTMGDAVTAFVNFIEEKSPPIGDDIQRASQPKPASGGKGKSSNSKDDGTNPPPDDEAGNGDADEEAAAQEEEG